MRPLLLIFLFLFFFFCVPLKVIAQGHYIGIKGGINFANVAYSGFADVTTARKGFQGGLTYDYFLNNHVAFGAEVLFSQRGFRDNFSTGNNVTHHAVLDYSYIALPVKATYSVGSRFFAMESIGLIPAFRSTATISSDLDGNNDNSKNVKSFDLGAFVEIAGGYRFKRTMIYASGAYQHSFTNLNSSGPSSSALRHYGFVPSVGIKYRLSE